MRTDALDYELPESLIATTPAEPRDSARLMVLRRDSGAVEHRRVRDLPGLGVFEPGDLMLVNQTRVLPAYLVGVRSATGGRVSGLFIDSDADGRWRLMLESRGKLRPGERIMLGRDAHAASTAPHPAGQADQLALIEPLGDGRWLAQLHGADDTPTVLGRVGSAPLPPYIRRQRRKLGLDEVTADDDERYNTVYAGESGSVAAPTAGLHFTPGLLAAIKAMGVHHAAVDLHVGMGTFAPVRSDTLDGHAMHAEWFSVPRATLDAMIDTRRRGGRLLVVGTTTVRALESLPSDALDSGRHPAGYAGTTGLFIRPDRGFDFRFTDRLMTNFHLPRSTLLALVAALPGVGLPALLERYREAVAHGYRFYSYGDAMLIV